MAQVGSLYKGEIRNWKVVGGPDKAVSLYGRQSNSGTYTFMQEHVLGNKNYSPDVKEMNGNAQIIESVIQDEGGVGYVGVGYLFDKNGKIRKGLKVLNISKDASGEAFSPLEKINIDSGDYPISRPLYQAINGKPGPAIAAFLTFETGPEGQKIVEREGFFTIGEAHKAQNDKNLECDRSQVSRGLRRPKPAGRSMQEDDPRMKKHSGIKEAGHQALLLQPAASWPSSSSSGSSSSWSPRPSPPSGRSRSGSS